MEAFAIYNEDSQEYLTGGTYESIVYSGNTNPLRAHLYDEDEIAERQAKTLLTQFMKHMSHKPLPLLSVHKLSNPTITITPTGIIEPTPKKTGYSIEFVATPKDDATGGVKPFTDYIRNTYGALNRVCSESDYYYGKISQLLARNAKPSIWKTKTHAEKLLEQLQPVIDAEITPHWTFTAKVVKISV